MGNECGRLFLATAGQNIRKNKVSEIRNAIVKSDAGLLYLTGKLCIMITSIKYKVAEIKRDYILNVIQSNGADKKYRKQRRRIQMTEVCPKCGREFMNSRTGKCPICKMALVEKISYSEDVWFIW